MLCYWQDPQRTAEAIDDEGFMHTGNLAVMDDGGYLSIVGRSKDMVIRGGENIYPREVEEFLFTHPDVRDVQVIGVPDARYGEELCAWIQPREGATLEADFASRMVPRQPGALQDPALRPLLRRLRDDGHRQGPEIQDAADLRGGARAALRGVRGSRLIDRPLSERGHAMKRNRDPRRPGKGSRRRGTLLGKPYARPLEAY
jgi:hypothetical protein